MAQAPQPESVDASWNECTNDAILFTVNTPLATVHLAGDPSFADIMQVKQNANRAANLVRQLLAFSRQQTLQPRIIDITDVLVELSHLLRRLIGESIELKVVHGREQLGEQAGEADPRPTATTDG